jgi:WD40 repeat protein
MGDVFISYSRRDKDFVVRLHDALQQAGRNVWVDWEGIPPSAEWMREIYAAVESADAVLFVISSHSAASHVCAQEVLHAVGNNKRLIPVVLEDIDPALLPQPVAERNWIFFRATDDFDRAFSLLISAADVDLDWTKRHTRLLTRALEWQNHKRDYAYALRGSDLREAEHDLALNETKDPRLAGQQIQYILESRRQTNRRRHIALGATSIAALVLIVVGLLFWQKRYESNLNLARNIREKAVEELFNGDPLSAEVYFARSLTIDDELETRQLLLEARARSARLLWLGRRPAGSSLLGFSPDGTRYLVQSGDNLELWDMSTRERVRSWRAGTQKVSAVAFSKDMHLLAIGRAQSVEVWSIGSPGPALKVSIRSPQPTTSLAISPTDDLIVAGAIDGTISIFDLRVPERQPIGIRSHQNRVSSFAFTPDGQFLASGSWDNTVKVWAVTAGEEQRSLKELQTLTAHNDAVLSVAFSPDGSVVASGSWDNRIWLWDRRTGQRLRQLRGHTGGIVALAFSADGKWLASGSEDRTARVWIVETGRLLVTLPGLEGDVESIAFAGPPPRHQLATADENGTIRIWDLDARGQREALATLRGHERPVSAIAFNPPQDQLASGSWDRTVRLWNLKTKVEHNLGTAHTDSVTAVAFNPDGRVLLSAGKDGAVRVWDLANGSSHVLERGEDAAPVVVRDVTFSPDGKLIASANDDSRVRIWNTADQRLVKDFSLAGDSAVPEKVLSVAFSPDGRLLATGSEDHEIRIWRVADWMPLRTLTGHEKEVWQVAFSPDSKLLFSASDDRTARVWDVATGRQLGKPLRHEAPVWSIDVSPDGKTLLTGASDSSAHLWTIASRGDSVQIAHRFTLRLSEEPIWKVAFSHRPGDALIAIAGADNDIHVLNLNRLDKLFDDLPKLARQATAESGLEIAPGPDLRIIPIQAVTAGGKSRGRPVREISER